MTERQNSLETHDNPTDTKKLTIFRLIEPMVKLCDESRRNRVTDSMIHKHDRHVRDEQKYMKSCNQHAEFHLIRPSTEKSFLLLNFLCCSKLHLSLPQALGIKIMISSRGRKVLKTSTRRQTKSSKISQKTQISKKGFSTLRS